MPGKRLFSEKDYVVDDRGYKTPCWIWVASKAGHDGYAQYRRGLFRGQMAHRAVYQILVGPIPEGQELDHLCGQALCVNPEHAEPVSRLENVRRSGRDNSGIAKRMWEKRSPEERAAIFEETWARRTPEERRAIALKAWETQRRRRASK